jgi:hypothetical protein
LVFLADFVGFTVGLGGFWVDFGEKLSGFPMFEIPCSL